MFTDVGAVDDRTLRRLRRYCRDMDDELVVTDPRVAGLLPVFSPTGMVFTKLPAKTSTERKLDDDRYLRYHIPIVSNPHTRIMVYPATGYSFAFYLSVGRIYEVRTSVEYREENDGDADRIHLIVETTHGIETRRL